MKSQPDAASRVAAEVVTQLPVPSRLGMLRFERLNEASWAMLYLDPNCERQFGLPAAELCALVGSPYASLMEPGTLSTARQIQQQLPSAHYLVRYTLHTSDGPLSLLEMGEAYKQHNRHLLRGYLMVVDGLFTKPAPAIWKARTTACRWPWSSTSAPSRNNCSTWSGCAPSRT
jgi:hypothetical protein